MWEPSRHEGYLRLAMPGSLIACAIEVGDRREYGSFDSFQTEIAGTMWDTSQLTNRQEVVYRSTRGNRLQLRYRSPGWLPDASINGVALDFDRWPTCESPYVRCRDQVLDVNDGHSGFTIDWQGDYPQYSYYEIADGQRRITRRE
jgi:hypothetical protein